jgi:Pumilio-family RNA binding repeat
MSQVVQKLLAVAPPVCMTFIVPLLRGRVAEIARDDYGCRVLQRCFHDLSDRTARPLIDEFLPYTLEMVTHEFGVSLLIMHSSFEPDRYSSRILSFKSSSRAGSKAIEPLYSSTSGATSCIAPSTSLDQTSARGPWNSLIRLSGTPSFVKFSFWLIDSQKVSTN